MPPHAWNEFGFQPFAEACEAGYNKFTKQALGQHQDKP
jgi:hypothetical protein